MEETETSEKTVFGLGENLLLLGKGAVLVVIFRLEMLFFGDETRSRRLFCAEISTFWRRDPFSSSFLCRKLHFLATRPVLVVFFVRKSPLFGDETRSRRRFETENAIFWRRHPFSSSFLDGEPTFLATKPLLVVFLWRKTHFFGDETPSRRLFVAENPLFWRRNPFSSSFFGRKLHFLATRSLLVVILWRKTHFFGDETPSRRHFWAGNSIFWRRDPFSSPFWDRRRYFLATTLILVAFFAPEPPLFGDETFSSSFLCVNKYTNYCFSAFDCL